MLNESVQKRLMNSVKKHYAIKDNFYHIKSVNDILFNNQLLDEEQLMNGEGEDGEELEPGRLKGGKKNWNLQQLTGKLLTAVFKDFLIFDDIFEFVQCFWPTIDSAKYIVKYAKY